ncbi:MAG: protein-L-isoaspartate(D-aspartate) O-methyltransferase, partial [Thermoplasmata archaeon]|nr:protein-L-isoaspartate(D-aspartate) O-methyltransferase [Thermoplasmata archaeon]
MMVRRLKAQGILTDRRVEEAMLAVPREIFVPPAMRDEAYEDTPLPIGEGQTISAPHMVAMMTQLLQVEEGDRILEIGTGSGYQAAILAFLVGEGGHVHTVERHETLAREAERRLESIGLADRVTVHVADGSQGIPEHAPYDGIIVTCGAP